MIVVVALSDFYPVYDPLHFSCFRIENLELLSKYGSNAWRIHNETLTKILSQQQKKLADIKYVWYLSIKIFRIRDL